MGRLEHLLQQDRVGAQNFVPKNVGAGFKPVPTRSPPRVGDIGGCEEVQDTSCQGFGGVPQINESPTLGGLRGLINTIL